MFNRRIMGIWETQLVKTNWTKEYEKDNTSFQEMLEYSLTIDILQQVGVNNSKPGKHKHRQLKEVKYI